MSGELPTVAERATVLDPEVGNELHRLIERLYPICRSITGPGVRQTLAILAEHLGEAAKLAQHEVPTGTEVFDWTVPKEWTLRSARLIGPSGNALLDAADHNLYLLNYSVPHRATVPRAELDEHLFSLPEQPDLIPYRTSYYREAWGFCLPDRLRKALPEGDYRVEIDTELADGSLTYGEIVLPRNDGGTSAREVLVSTHVCHPSLANDNLSGVAVTLFLAKTLAGCRRRFTYRFVYLPGTIGSITWLARNPDAADRVAYGLVAANLGDDGFFHYKRSRRGDAEIDRAVAHLLACSGREHEILDFVPFGYDERQYCSPGFDLPVGSISRTPWGRYPQYHTSADNLDFVKPAALAGSLEMLLSVVALLESNRTYRNLNPHCEPQLGRRGLYRMIGGDDTGRERELALLWVLNQSDGKSSLLDVAERSGVPFGRILEAAEALVDTDLLEEVDPAGTPPGKADR